MERKLGFCCVLIWGLKFKSLSNVTHGLARFPPEGGGWLRGARAGGSEEGEARGKVRAGDGSEARGSK